MVAETAIAHGAPREDVPDDERLPIDTLYGLWARAVATTGITALPVRVGARAGFDRYGALGIALYVSRDNATALRRLARYHDLLTDSGHWQLRTEDDAAIVRWVRDEPDDLGLRLANEHVLASFATVLRQITDASEIREVRFRHTIADTTEHEAHFRAPVRVAAENAIVLPATMLREKPRASDPFVESFIVAQIATAAGSEPTQLVGEVSRILVELLPDGPPAIEEIAARVELPERTLRRRLADAGTSFNDLLTGLQREHAIALLQRGNSVAEIARAVGFSSTSTFSRAFKRWVGVAPTDFLRRRE